MPRYSRHDLELAVAKSDNYSATLRALGLCQTGGNNEVLRRWIKEWNVDTSHFLTPEERIAKARSFLKDINKGKPLEDILVKDSAYTNSNHLKKKLYKEGIKTSICELCGQDENWRGKRMALILDHINGDKSDNRLINLQIVCPNCNATLETFCGRRPPRQIKKRIGGQRGIARPQTRKIERPSFEDLRTEIDQSNYSAVGRKYGVSDNAIRKWIKFYEEEEKNKV